MTSDEVYNLAYKSHEYYSNVETSLVTWETPSSYDSLVGKVSYTYTSGIQVSKNIQELIKAFSNNAIDVWICSASYIDVIRAAIDYFGLHYYVKGIVAMTNKVSEGKIINEYDYENGCSYLVNKDWVKSNYATKAQTQGEGKVTAINNAIYPFYNEGPAAGFMDSTGDFNFCSEYSSLQLVVCFNRATRKVTDGGGLIAEVAMYQKDTLKYDLAKALKNKDTYYVLQGRDENGLRTFRNSNATLRYGAVDEKLFANDNNTSQLEYMISNKMTTKDILNTFAIKTSEEESVLGFKYGFLDSYSGYHSI